MVGKYVTSKLNNEKNNLESVVNDFYNEIERNNQKNEYTFQDKITKIFPLNRYDEGMEIISLFDDISNYLASEHYDGRKQKRLIIRISNALKTIKSI